jgi:hypothetical protein
LLHYDSPSEIAFTLIGSNASGGLAYEKHVISPKTLYSVYAVLAGLLAFVLVITAITYVARYVSTSALIQMVDLEAENDVHIGVLQGLRLGWSQSAWRLFWIDLVLNLLALLAFVGLFIMVASPLLLAVRGGGWQVIIGSILTSGLFFLAILMALVGGALLSLVRVIVHRACVLEGAGVLASILSGIRTIKSNIVGAGMTWLVWFGVGVLWPILMLPVVLMLFALAIFFGGLPGAFVGWITALAATGEALPILLGLIVGMTLFLLTLIMPMAFLDGLREVFISSMWTLAYRGLRGGKLDQQIAVPVPGRPSLESAGSV